MFNNAKKVKELTKDLAQANLRADYKERAMDRERERYKERLEHLNYQVDALSKRANTKERLADLYVRLATQGMPTKSINAYLAGYTAILEEGNEPEAT